MPASDATTDTTQPAAGVLRVRVRYVECDPMGVAHHASYLPWLEMGRTELLRAGGPDYAQMEREGCFLVVTKLEIKFRRPVRYDDVVEVRTKVVGGGRVKIEHEYELVVVERSGGPPEGVVCTARTQLACVGRDGKVRELPEGLGMK